MDLARLIDKLRTMGIPKHILKYVFFMLYERTVKIKVNNSLSDSVKVSKGILQGSHSGPLLINIFMNDIFGLELFSEIDLYADDIRIYKNVNSPFDQFKINYDLTLVHEWLTMNGLIMNIDKTDYIKFKLGSLGFNYEYNINGLSIRKVTVVKHLGVYYDSKLTFGDHIRIILKKAFKTLGFIHRVTYNFSDIQCIIYLFRSLVMPNLLYCSPIWSPYLGYQIKSLESVQRKFIRFLSFKTDTPMSTYDHDYHLLSEKLNLHTIYSIHRYNDVLLV